MPTNIDFESKKFVIPAIIPPLKLKPVLSNKYIDIWHKASEWIRNASKIIIVGYSFAYADEHFNDILRSNQGKEVYVINPSAEQLMERLSKIYGYRRDDFTQVFTGERTDRPSFPASGDAKTFMSLRKVFMNSASTSVTRFSPGLWNRWISPRCCIVLKKLVRENCLPAKTLVYLKCHGN